MTWIKNLRLPDGRSLTLNREFEENDPNDLTLGTLSPDDLITWRTVAILAGIDTSDWPT